MVDGLEGRLRTQTISLQAYTRRITARAATYVDTFMAVMARVQLGVILSDADTREIVAFLESLTGELPASFATVPVLPSGAPVSLK